METIMAVDDNLTNLTILKTILEQDYKVIPLPSGEKALEVLKKNIIVPDLILLDIDMPGITGFDVVRELKKDIVLQQIPVILLSAYNDGKMIHEGIELGVDDYVTKPFSTPLLIKRIELHLGISKNRKMLARFQNTARLLEQEKAALLVELQHSIIEIIGDLIQKRDNYTGEHATRVEQYMKILLNALIEEGICENIQPEEVDLLAQSSRLHDVGKIAIPDRILLKENKLDEEEVAIMRTHTTVGADAILKSMEQYKDSLFLQNSLDMTKYHHEKWNGEGYPEGRKGEQIPFIARALAVVDVYDALRSKRVYKEPLPHEVAVEEIRKGAGVHFDPKIVAVFQKVHEKFDETFNEFNEG